MPLWIIISYLVLCAFCAYSAVKLNTEGRKAYAKSVITTFIAYSVVFIAIWIMDVDVPSYQVLLSILTVLFTCFIGNGLNVFNTSKTFDRYLHAFGTFSFALFTYSILDDFVRSGGSKLFRAIFIFSLGVALSVLFEMSEMMHDRKRKKTDPKSQKGLIDIDMDLCFNLIGSVIAGAFAYCVFL